MTLKFWVEIAKWPRRSRLITPSDTSCGNPNMHIWCNLIADQIHYKLSSRQAEFHRILSQNGQNDLEGQSQWPPFSISTERIPGRMFGVNLMKNEKWPIWRNVCFSTHTTPRVIYQTQDKGVLEQLWIYIYMVYDYIQNIICHELLHYYYAYFHQDSSITMIYLDLIFMAMDHGLLYQVVIMFNIYCFPHIDVLVQERRNSSALAMELCLSCTNPSI